MCVAAYSVVLDAVHSTANVVWL